MSQTIQQERAAFALEKVTSALANQSVCDDLKGHAQSLPAMIHMNGLGQAAAFCRSGKKEAQTELYRMLSDWLCREHGPLAPHEDLLAGIVACDMQVYMRAQAEALALADWVKRFAAAFTPPGAASGAEPVS